MQIILKCEGSKSDEFVKVKSSSQLWLNLSSIIAPLKYHVFENIMENGAFALLEQMLHFSIIFSKVFKT